MPGSCFSFWSERAGHLAHYNPKIFNSNLRSEPTLLEDSTSWRVQFYPSIDINPELRPSINDGLEPPHLASATNFAVLSTRLCHVDDKPKWKRTPTYERQKGCTFLWPVVMSWQWIHDKGKEYFKLILKSTANKIQGLWIPYDFQGMKQIFLKKKTRKENSSIKYSVSIGPNIAPSSQLIHSRHPRSLAHGL